MTLEEREFWMFVTAVLLLLAVLGAVVDRVYGGPQQRDARRRNRPAMARRVR